MIPILVEDDPEIMGAYRSVIAQLKASRDCFISLEEKGVVRRLPE